jgi:hypothetical protein
MILGKIASYPFRLARSFVNHANEEQRRHKVFPVPVGDSSKAFSPFYSASMTLDM